jgi:deazaflavin-dependent oxidoreductase (nitroreductase family)
VEERVARALAEDGTIDITTVGARSGLPRRMEIWFLHLDDRTFITGTSGPRHWFANLCANPEFTVHLKESAQANLAAHAVPVTDEPTRRWVLSQPHRWNEWYLDNEPLESLVATAPMVEVFFDS